MGREPTSGRTWFKREKYTSTETVISLVTRIPLALHKKLWAERKRRNVSINLIINEALKKYFEEATEKFRIRLY